MAVEALTIVGTVSSVLDLAKVAWKLGSALVKLYQDTQCVDDTVEKLAGEVKSLGNECDLIHAELVDVVKASEKGESSPYDIDGRLWKCLATKVEECEQTIQALGVVVDDVADKSFGFIGQAQRQMKLNQNRSNLQKMRARIRTHTDGLRTTLLVINIKVAHLAPANANRELSQKLDTLQAMIDALQRSMKGVSRASTLDTDTTLVQCAREVITQGSTLYEASLAAPSILGGQGAASSNIRVAQWVGAIDALRSEEPFLEQSDTKSSMPSVFSGDGEYRSLTDATSAQHEAADRDAEEDSVGHDSDDELAVELAKAALEASVHAFEASEWREADSLLQETLRLLQQLPKGQRGFCDTFDLQYKLAVCAYHTQKPVDAEGALTSLLHQAPNSNKQRRQVCDIAHLLSLLYIRMDEVERARSSCEKALQARRRLLGKNDDATLASLALMTRIYARLHHPTLAKVYLTMIPEARKPETLRSVDDLLGPEPNPFDDLSTLGRSHSGDSSLDQSFSRLDIVHSNSEATSSTRSGELSPSTRATSRSSRETLESPNMHGRKVLQNRSSIDEYFGPAATAQTPLLDSNTAGPSGLPVEPGTQDSVTNSAGDGVNLQSAIEQPPEALTRKEILNGLGLRPKTALDEAICYGAQDEYLSKLLQRCPRPPSGVRNLFKSSPTPLHYAALFGEVETARRILRVGEHAMDVSTRVMVFYTMGSPFHWAVLSRQAEVLDMFLTIRLKSLNTLANAPTMSSEMYKWWVSSTISKAEQSHGTYIPNQFIAMAKVLLKHGWSINRGISMGQWTLLHYAAYLGNEYDPFGMISSFLCKEGASPMARAENQETPYDIASRSSNSTLVEIFKQDIADKIKSSPSK